MTSENKSINAKKEHGQKTHGRLRSALGVCVTICILILIVLGIDIYRSNYTVTSQHYSIDASGSTEESATGDAIRMVLLSDLHNSEFGEGNQKLIDRVASASPDVIFIAGDLLNYNEERTDIAVHLLKELVKIAPVYVAYGNHEKTYEERYGTDIAEQYRQTGVTFLEKEYVDVEIKEQEVRIGGIYGYCLPAKFLSSHEAKQEECDYLEEFLNTERYTILMCHMPACWLLNSDMGTWDVDLVLSGHVHGGQIVVPFLGGMYGPDFGWWPGRLSGVYSLNEGETHLILTPGLGNTEKIPRINNIPEVTVADVVLPLSKGQ